MEQPSYIRSQVIRNDVFPDDVLLKIFDFYVEGQWYERKIGVEKWRSLVQVCRRWRSLVFRSARRLNLRLFCTSKTPVKNTLDVWPPLPILIRGEMTSSCTENIIAVLGERHRVTQVTLFDIAGWQMEEILAAMKMPFPVLTNVRLRSDFAAPPAISDSFLGGSAPPSLQYFELNGIPFPGMPKLLASATRMSILGLFNIPHSGYISPEAMVGLLSVLPSLKGLSLKFESSQSRPDRETRRPPPSERSVIPSMMYLYFKGATEYLEDLVANIDAPQLDDMQITFFDQIDFDTPQLAQFINRTLKLTKRNAHVEFDDYCVRVGLPHGYRTLEIAISCREPDRQFSSIEQVCNSSLHPLSTIEDLYLEYKYLQLVGKNDAIEDHLWLQLLLPFTGVKNLFLSEEFSPGIAAALQELVGDRITEVLPGLQSIFVGGLEASGPFQENIGQFVAARQLSNHPITIFDWDENLDTKSK